MADSLQCSFAGRRHWDGPRRRIARNFKQTTEKKTKKKHEISDRRRIPYRAHLQVDDTGMARADVLRRGAVGEVPRHHGARGIGRPDATRGGIDDDAGDVDLDKRGQRRGKRK